MRARPVVPSVTTAHSIRVRALGNSRRSIAAAVAGNLRTAAQPGQQQLHHGCLGPSEMPVAEQGSSGVRTRCGGCCIKLEQLLASVVSAGEMGELLKITMSWFWSSTSQRISLAGSGYTGIGSSGTCAKKMRTGPYEGRRKCVER